MNKPLLISFMARYQDTQETLAKALDLSVSRLNAKINERDGASFDQKEMRLIIRRYNLSTSDAMAIFFPNELSPGDKNLNES